MKPAFDLTQIPPAVIRRLFFACDVDKTLTRVDRTIAPETARAIQALYQVGGGASVCTGRSFPFLPAEILKLFPDSALHVVAGGAQVINQKGERLWGNELPGALVKELIQLVISLGGRYGFGLGTRAYSSPERFAQLKVWFPDLVWAEWTDVPDLAHQQVPELVVVDMTDKIRAALAQYADVITVKEMKSREKNMNADVTMKGVTKATGLRELARLKQIPLAEITTVGDDNNDFELLQVGWGVAMGNAIPELKASAKLVVGETEANGLAEFIMAMIAARQTLLAAD